MKNSTLFCLVIAILFTVIGIIVSARLPVIVLFDDPVIEQAISTVFKKFIGLFFFCMDIILWLLFYSKLKVDKIEKKIKEEEKKEVY